MPYRMEELYLVDRGLEKLETPERRPGRRMNNLLIRLDSHARSLALDLQLNNAMCRCTTRSTRVIAPDSGATNETFVSEK